MISGDWKDIFGPYKNSGFQYVQEEITVNLCILCKSIGNTLDWTAQCPCISSAKMLPLSKSEYIVGKKGSPNFALSSDVGKKSWCGNFMVEDAIKTGVSEPSRRVEKRETMQRVRERTPSF